MNEARIAYQKEPRMTVSEIARKYDEDRKTVRIALEGVTPDGKRNKTYVYREIDAADALIKMYRKRRDKHEHEMKKWELLIHQVEMTYEEGYEE